MPPLKDEIALDVYCLIPYRTAALCRVAPEQENAPRNREIVFAFKNGRAMRRAYGGHSFHSLSARMVKACGESPLGGPAAAGTVWVPVPRSGASQPSTDPGSDPYPCWTLAKWLAARLGGGARQLLDRRSPPAGKRHVQAAIDTLELAEPLPSPARIVLVDDVCTSGSTLASCAAFLRDRGYQGTIAAFCVAYDVAQALADQVQPRKTTWRVTWSPDRPRSTTELVGPWDRAPGGRRP